MTEHQPISTTWQPVRLRLEDYLLLDRSGAFNAYVRTELLGGELFFMNAQHRPHAYLKAELAYRLRRAIEALDLPCYVLTEASVAVPPSSAPEPDIVITDDPIGEGLVPLASVKLLIEVADATLEHDLTRKLALYAVAGVPEYWVADVNGRVIHHHAGPDGDRYTHHHIIGLGTACPSTMLPGLSIETAGL